MLFEFSNALGNTLRFASCQMSDHDGAGDVITGNRHAGTSNKNIDPGNL
jgi:hypothetical protein